MKEARVKRTRGQTSSAFVVLVSAAALLALGQVQASATNDVTSVTGSAFGYWAHNVSLFGGGQTDTGPTPTVSLTANASNSPQSASAPSGLVQYGPAVIFTSDAIAISATGALGTGGSANATSDVNNINKSTTQSGSTGSEVFAADNLHGTCSAPADSAVTGSTTMAPTSFSYQERNNLGILVTKTATSPGGLLQTDSGWDDGDTFYPEPAASAGGLAEHDAVWAQIPASPAPNTSMTGHIHLSATSQDDFQVVFNEQSTSGGVLTVTPVHEIFGTAAPDVLVGHLYLGQVSCGVTTVPTPTTTTSSTTTTTQPTTTTTTQPTTTTTTQPTTTTTTAPPNVADLAVSLNGPTSAPVLSAQSYTASVTNNGPDDATGAVLTITSSGLRGPSFATSDARCTLVKGKNKGIRCNLGTVTTGDTVAFTVTMPRKAGTLTLTAALTATSVDNNPSNGQGTLAVNVFKP